MSLKVSKRVWANSTAAGSERLMLLAIADFADDDGSAFPSIATLARMCNTGERNAMYLLKALQERGELRVDRNAGRRGTNVYQVLLPEVQEGSRVQSASPVKGSAPLQPSAPLQAAAPVGSRDQAGVLPLGDHRDSIGMPSGQVKPGSPPSPQRRSPGGEEEFAYP